MTEHKALKTIGDWISRETQKRRYDHEEIKELSEALIILKECAEKRTPKKVKPSADMFVDHECECGRMVDYHHYCVNCGQKLDVDFITAVKSGKNISVRFSGANYSAMSLPNLFYELQQDYSDKVIRQIILNGKWFIED